MKFAAAIAIATLYTTLGLAAPTVPRKAPELSYTVPDQGQKLLSQYHGNVVVIEFILTTCPHCQAASKLMTKLQEEYGPRGFQAIDVAINGLDEGRNSAQADQLIQAFSRTYQVGFPVAWTPRDQFLSFCEYSIMDRTVVPQIVIIDRKGMIRYQTPASGDEESYKESTIRQRVEELLKEPLAGHVTAKAATARRHGS